MKKGIIKSIESPDDAARLSITTRMLIEEALNRHYKVEYIPAYSDDEQYGSGVATCVKNQKSVIFKSDYTNLTPSYGFFTAEIKSLTYNLLKAGKVPFPKTWMVNQRTSTPRLRKILDQAAEVVIKPVDTNHGDGITIGVTTITEMQKAIKRALNVSKRKSVIVQKRVYGEEYRFLVLQGKVIAVSHRRPPFVTGNGTDTVEKLIEKLNQDPRRGNKHTSALTKVSLSDVKRANQKGFLKTVPEQGWEVELLKTSNLSKGGFAEDLTDIAGDILKKIAVKAAKACSLGLAGVDIMTSDIENGGTTNSYVIEVNLAPGLRMHEFPSIGQPRPVVKMIFDELEKHTVYKKKPLQEIGRFAYVELNHTTKKLPARIDTGARTTAIWASEIVEKNGMLSWEFAAKGSEYWTGQKFTNNKFEKNHVMSSNGHRQLRYKVPINITINDRTIKTFATLADRSHAAFPILVGCNTLTGKFYVNVQKCPKKLAEIYNNWYNKSGLKKSRGAK
ncbi:MAG: RimK/LysX family protein [Candidatus Nomurabacteria bacterium]|nr:RimK/LysX family protein [Candidatus Nomurabacteria bacterium]